MRFRKTLTLLVLAMGLVFALSAWAQQKPLTQNQVQGLVRDGLGDESGAKLVEQRGIDFAPAEDLLQSLKAAGANEVFLKALRAAKRPQPAGGATKKPLNQVLVFALLVGQVASHRVAMLVQEHGIDFEPTDDYLQQVRIGGGEEELISALKSAKVTKPTTVDPVAQARQVEMRQHLSRGTELNRQGQYAEAEREVRAALLLDSQDADLYASLSYILMQQRKWDDAATAAREAIHLDPSNDGAHNNLGVALGKEGDWDGEIAEEREALRLNANNEQAHVGLGLALGKKGDLDGAIAEYRVALRLNPKNDSAHVGLGFALGKKDDWDGAIAQYREALRLNPNNALAHSNLGVALEKKGDRQGALEEYRAANRLDPKNAHFKENYERLSQPLSHLAESTPTDISGEWKSLTNGKTFKVRVEQGHAYVEKLVTEEDSKLGIFQLCDLGSEGDKYRGTCRSQGVGRWYDRWHHQERTRACQFQGQLEFIKYSPSRIEGRFETRGVGEKWSDKDRSNCGERFPVEWSDFVWIRPN